MTWIRVDDHFADHPKVMALGRDRLSGLGLWHVAASYSARYLTDGYVPASFVKAQAPQRLIARMVEVRLFKVAGENYLLHDWLEYNPSREKVMGERQAAKDRMTAKRSPSVRPNNGATTVELPENLIDPVPVPVPVPVPEILSNVSVTGMEPWVEPAEVYLQRTRRRVLSQKERNWIEDLHARFSRKELARALQVVDPGPDYLRRVDQFLEGAA
jgi:hypothetical protein